MTDGNIGFIGKELMDRWNYFEDPNRNVNHYAKMGHLEDDKFVFVIERFGVPYIIHIQEGE